MPAGGPTGFVAALLWLSAAVVLVEAQESMEGSADARQVRDAKTGPCVFFSGGDS